MGVFAALERAGIAEGAKVRIGNIEFTWDSTYEPEVRPSGHTTPAAPRTRR
jgi:hypothetical protein